MGKTKRADSEYTREQRLRHENQKLKREVALLRKELYRSQNSDIEKTFAREFTSHIQQEVDQQQADLKREWACKIPECEGVLQIIKFNKIAEQWYYRACTHCANRTKSQRYDSKRVKGIFKS